MPSIEHPGHTLPDDLIACNKLLEQNRSTMLERQGASAVLARPDARERDRIADLRTLSARARGVTDDMVKELRALGLRRFDRVSQTLADRPRLILERTPIDLQPGQPAAIDPTFWWARTDIDATSRTPGEPDEGSQARFGTDFRDDGLHITGGVTTHDGDLYYDHVGAVALFGLDAARIPASGAHLWRSTPYVELFGGVLGYTGDDDIFTGDLWSKCWMHRDQQLFQMGFGPNGPVPIVVGQAHDSEQLIFEEDGDRSVYATMPGFKWMPPVTFGNLLPGQTLWARLEVRFDIQTEGAGTLLWMDPEVLLRTFQWPLTPL